MEVLKNPLGLSTEKELKNLNRYFIFNGFLKFVLKYGT
jgi:hypothetical protein